MPQPKRSRCSASSRSKNKRVTCFSDDQVRELALAYNRATRGEKIDAGAEPRRVLEELRARLAPLCDTERCWLGLGLLDHRAERKLDLAFAPKMPEAWQDDPNTWLSNHDIEEALKRNTAHRKDFAFLGVFPMDFMGQDSDGRCVSNMCGFDAAGLADKGVKSAGMVLNTDKHTGKGIHWVSVFICASPRDQRYGVYYFDSTGRPPTPEVDSFAERVTQQLVRTHGPGREPVYAYNDHHHQWSTTECGVFCIHFVMRMLGRRCFRTVCGSIGDDLVMFKLRNQLFDSAA